MFSPRHQLVVAIAALSVLLLTGCSTKCEPAVAAPEASPAPIAATAPTSSPAPATSPAPSTGPAPATTPGTNPGAPVTNPPPGAPLPPEQIDLVVRKILAGYLDALNRGSWAEAAGYWSLASSVTPASGETLKVVGVSDYHFQSSELIKSTETTAYVQLNFDVKAAVGVTGLTDGRNVWYVHLSKLDGAWKITSISPKAEM
ncbi:MAG TPA: hypothetical protein VK191_10230 [Symbiobacteriaceae bacterium]|nr:hypothetical protein [Symbiobacteriaceae bacterium]